MLTAWTFSRHSLIMRLILPLLTLHTSAVRREGDFMEAKVAILMYNGSMLNPPNGTFQPPNTLMN